MKREVSVSPSMPPMIDFMVIGRPSCERDRERLVA
jgi:hypothetical protein